MRIPSRFRDACSVTAAPLATLASASFALELAIPGIVSRWMPLPLLVLPSIGAALLAALAAKPPGSAPIGGGRLALLLAGIALIAAVTVRAAGGSLVGGRFLLAVIGAMLVVAFSLLKDRTRYE